MISYRRAVDIEERLKKIVEKTGMSYVDVERIRCVRSYGSSSRNTAARIHSVSKAFLTGFGMKPCYVIEFVAEIFDKLPPSSQDEVIIHELLHIPKSFSGGLLPHGRINFRKDTKTLKKMLR
ncbi:MAG: putative metallopeptidase [Candidatus Caldarchaeum sp.]|nr:putative metallopeptidase [Candidatus Caldarchaeum sp.]